MALYRLTHHLLLCYYSFV